MIHDPSLQLHYIKLRKPAEQRQIQGEVKEVSPGLPGWLKQTKVEFEKKDERHIFFGTKKIHIFMIFMSVREN